MLNTLQNLNQNKKVHHIHSSNFSKYGTLLQDVPTHPLKCWFLNNIDISIPGVGYIPDANVSIEIQNSILPAINAFGGLPTEIGFCWGKNTLLNGLEYHKSSEITIALTDIIIIVGHISDISNDTYNTSLTEIFYVPANTSFELYNTTLHYAPCMVNNNGFVTCVILPCGTNTPLEDSEKTDELLFMKNKWLLCHENNVTDINNGGKIGLIGDNICINI